MADMAQLDTAISIAIMRDHSKIKAIVDPLLKKLIYINFCKNLWVPTPVKILAHF